MSKTVRENLIAAKALISTPEKWNTSGSFGHDGCWCAVGALEMAGEVFQHYSEKRAEWEALWAVLPDEAKTSPHPELGDIFVYNDDPDTTHADIMALFQRAIDAEEAKEARS